MAETVTGYLNELMFILLEGYAYKLSIEVLTKDVKKTGANPELANMNEMRMVVTKIQMGLKYRWVLLKK